MKGHFSLKAFVVIQEVRKCAHFIKYKILIFNLLKSANSVQQKVGHLSIKRLIQ